MIHKDRPEAAHDEPDPRANCRRPPSRRLTAITLSKAGLDLARRLRAGWPGPGDIRIVGPSCVTGMCGSQAPLGRLFPTGEEALFGWRGPLRQVLPAIWDESDGIIAITALETAVRLIGPLAAAERHDRSVVVVEDAGRFAINLIRDRATAAADLTKLVAATLGAMPLVATSAPVASDETDPACGP